MEDNNEINSELEINENAEIAEARVETKVRSHHNNRPFNTIHVKDAIIEEIGSDRHSTSITITYREAGKRQTVRLLVTQSTRIWDEKGRPISVRQLEIGMMIDTVFSNAMTKSIPPQAEAFQIKVVLRQSRRNIIEGRIGQVDVRNQYILVLRSNSPASVIRFNIAPDRKSVV